MTITEFLLARIAEDEAGANEAEPGPWYVDDEEQTVRAREYAGEIMFDRSAECRSEWVKNFKPSAIHVARYDPARVLAECAAKRAILAEVARYGWVETPPPIIVRHLAAIYADHPGYQQEWAL